LTHLPAKIVKEKAANAEKYPQVVAEVHSLPAMGIVLSL
jgi:hypothetical protein